MTNFRKIEDSLEETVNDAIVDVIELLGHYLDEHKPDELPGLKALMPGIEEIIAGSLPILVSEINAAWYLHSHELIEAYENAGGSGDPLANDGINAIYYYLEQKVQQWYQDEATDIFSEWKDGQEEETL